MFSQQYIEELYSILWSNEELVDIIKNYGTSSDQLVGFIHIILGGNLKTLVNAALQNSDEVKKFIDIIASSQLKDLIINSMDSNDDKVLVDVALQNNGEVAKQFIDLVTSDRLKSAIPRVLTMTILRH